MAMYKGHVQVKMIVDHCSGYLRQVVLPAVGVCCGLDAIPAEFVQEMCINGKIGCAFSSMVHLAAPLDESRSR